MLHHCRDNQQALATLFLTVDLSALGAYDVVAPLCPGAVPMAAPTVSLSALAIVASRGLFCNPVVSHPHGHAHHVLPPPVPSTVGTGVVAVEDGVQLLVGTNDHDEFAGTQVWVA